MCLDELGNVAPLPNLGEIASTAASHNIQLVSIFHDIAQARARYGDQTLTAINNHRARMLLPGVADLDTLRYFSDLLGQQTTRPKQQPGEIKPPRERRPLAAPEQLRQLPHGHALLIYGRLAPTRIRLRAYHQDRHLKKLANPPPRPMSTDPLAPLSTSLGTWLGLDQRERWLWWEERWTEAIALADRYRLTLRAGWWEDSERVEAIAAFAAAVAAYDTGQDDQPAGKLQLLAQLDWLRGVLRGGQRTFDPICDRPTFDQHLLSLGCQPPHDHLIADPPANAAQQRDQHARELQAVNHRLNELTQRQKALTSTPNHRQHGGDHADRERLLLAQTIGELSEQKLALERQLNPGREPRP